MEGSSREIGVKNQAGILPVSAWTMPGKGGFKTGRFGSVKTTLLGYWRIVIDLILIRRFKLYYSSPLPEVHPRIVTECENLVCPSGVRVQGVKGPSLGNRPSRAVR